MMIMMMMIVLIITMNHVILVWRDKSLSSLEKMEKCVIDLNFCSCTTWFFDYVDAQ